MLNSEIDKALNYLSNTINRKDIWNNLQSFIKEVEGIVNAIERPTIEKKELQNFVLSMQGFEDDNVPSEFKIDKKLGGPIDTFIIKVEEKDCYRYYDCKNNVLIFKGQFYDLKRIGKILRILKNIKEY